MKTFKLTVTEDELRALIRHHANSLTYSGSLLPGGGLDYSNYSTETSERIHTLTKRLNKDTPEVDRDPRPEVADLYDEPNSQVAAAKTEQQSGW